jgi:hypothetical protein
VVVTVLLAELCGCAWRTEPDALGAWTPAVNLYSRNKIVCVPTAIGNLSGGLLGALLISPIVAIEQLVASSETEEITRVAVGFPALLTGGILGTPFLPFSYLASEKPCQSYRASSPDE